MAYKQITAVLVTEGGTEHRAFSAFSVLVGGDVDVSDPADAALQSAYVTEDTSAILTSSGAESIPAFQDFTVSPKNFQILAADPGAPTDGQVWYNSTTELFRGRKNGVTKTFDVS